MAIESYEQIMARLNGQQTQTPKAATDFSTYVQNLLLNPNPQGGMMSDAEAYRADPFRRQNAINASLDEALKKKQAEEAARAAAARGGMGMMGSGSGDSGGGVPLTQEQIDFLDRETPEERYARITGDWFGLKPMGMMMLDPIGTFLTYPKQDPSNVIVETRTGKTPAQIAQEQREAEAAAIARQQIANDILAREAENRAMSEVSRNYGGFRDNGTYVTSYGPVVSTSGMSPETRSGLEAAQASFGYGTNADYYGD